MGWPRRGQRHQHKQFYGTILTPLYRFDENKHNTKYKMEKCVGNFRSELHLLNRQTDEQTCGSHYTNRILQMLMYEVDIRHRGRAFDVSDIHFKTHTKVTALQPSVGFPRGAAGS